MIKYVIKYKYPSGSSSDPEERRLASAIQRYAYKQKTTYNSKFEKELRKLDWKPLKEIVQNNKDEIISFRNLHGRFPNKRSKDKKEKRLGGLLHGYTCKASSTYDYKFTKKVMGFGWSRQANKSKIREINFIKFYEINNRFPKIGSKNKEEHSLGLFGCNSANTKCRLYRPDFAKKIKRLGYITQLNLISSLKAETLQRCKLRGYRGQNKSKDKMERHDSSIYQRYSNSHSSKYDEEFTKQCNKFPTWEQFTKKDIHTRNKLKYLNWCNDTGYRPSQTADTNSEERRLFRLMGSYLVPSGIYFDSNFKKKIKQFPTSQQYKKRGKKK